MDALTPTALLEVLSRYGVTLSKRFGQNFLVDRNALLSLAAEIPAGDDITFIEIGAGALALTRALAAKGGRVITYEIDTRLQPVHKALLMDDAEKVRIDIRYEDALNADWCSQGPCGGRVILAGNLPYLWSSETVLKLIRSSCIRQAFLLFQREFALRLVGSTGTTAYGSLSVAAQMFFSVRRLLDLPPTVFFPRPEVSSTFLIFERRDISMDDAERDSFLRFIQQAFLHRRKKLADFFRRLDVQMTGELASVSQLRPEALTPADFLDLFRHIKGQERS